MSEEQNRDRKNKACWNCARYRAYYTKGLCNFDKLNYGLCRHKNETVDKHCVCEFWRNNIAFRGWRETVAKKKLNGIFDQLIEIRQILFEEKEERESESKK